MIIIRKNMLSNKNDYCIIFDVNKLHLDFDKWLKLELNKNDLTTTPKFK